MRHFIVSSLVGLFIVGAAVTASADASETVACRTRSTDQGTTQLVLKWDGTTAKGTLEHTAPSGNVTKLIVRAERHDDMIIADDIYEKDLVSHAAVIRVANGKRYMRTESSWLACE